MHGFTEPFFDIFYFLELFTYFSLTPPFITAVRCRNKIADHSSNMRSDTVNYSHTEAEGLGVLLYRDHRYSDVKEICNDTGWVQCTTPKGTDWSE